MNQVLVSVFPFTVCIEQKLWALRNATARQVTDIIGVSFIWLRRHLEVGIDYHKNPHPKKPNAAEITFTIQGVRRLLELIENPPQNISQEGNWNPQKRKINKVVSSDHTLDALSEKYRFGRYYWSRARSLRPDYFGWWGGTRVTPYVKVEYLSLALELIQSLKQQEHLNVRDGVLWEKRIRKRV